MIHDKYKSKLKTKSNLYASELYVIHLRTIESASRIKLFFGHLDKKHTHDLSKE